MYVADDEKRYRELICSLCWVIARNYGPLERRILLWVPFFCFTDTKLLLFELFLAVGAMESPPPFTPYSDGTALTGKSG